MAALDSFKAESFPWPTALVDAVRSEIAKHLWNWFTEHADDVLYEKRILFFKLKLRVKDCRALLEALLGPQPVAA